MSSASSTDARESRRDSGFTARHLYLLLAMAGATWAVVVARDTHPAALLLLSGAILAAGLTGAALHGALVGFLSGRSAAPAPLSSRDRTALEDEKALVLRSIKELEFDRGMGKVSDADFAEIGGRLRARALGIMETIEQLPPEGEQAASTAVPVDEPARVDGRFCAQCGATREPNARFCKHCGAKLT